MTLSRSRLAALVALAVVLGACSGGTATTGATGTPVSGGGASASAPTPTPTASPTPTPSASPTVGPLPSGFDPCTLLTDPEASAVNGVNYGPGVPNKLENGGVECVWQNVAVNASVVVQVTVWPSESDAEAAFSHNPALQHGSPTPVPNFADEAVIARAPAGTVSTGGIYVRDGVAVFDVVYLGGTVPSDGALVLAATLVLGTLP